MIIRVVTKFLALDEYLNLSLVGCLFKSKVNNGLLCQVIDESLSSYIF